MVSKAFQKDMDSYLEKKVAPSHKPISCQIQNKSLWLRFKCWIQLGLYKLKHIRIHWKHFFSANDEIDLQTLQTDVVVIKSSSSPASQFIRRVKRFFRLTPKKTYSKPEQHNPQDIDPNVIKELLKHSKR